MKRALVLMVAAGCASSPPPKPTPAPVAVVAPAPAPAPTPAPQLPPAHPDPWAGRTDLLSAPPLGYATKVELGAIERYTLPNGAQVILVPRHSAPVVSVTIGFVGGRLAEPVERAGLAAFTAQMLRKGTTTRTAKQIAKDIESAGASVFTSANTDALYVGCSGRALHFDLCLSNVSELILHSTFPEAEIGEVRKQLLGQVAQRGDSPSAIADVHWRNLVFGDDDPRGRSTSTTSVTAIDRAAVQRYQQARLIPSAAIIAIAGDFVPAQVKAKLAKAFGTWKKSPPPEAPKIVAPPSRWIDVRLVDKPDATQSAIVLAGPALSSRSPDFPAVMLMNYVLGGGGFSSRLMQTVRAAGGKTYGVRSRYESGRLVGAFVISTSTRSEETSATMKLISDELERMRSGGVTDSELQKAKANMIGGYGLGLETAGDVAESLLAAEVEGQDANYVVDLPARLEKVTVADVARVAKTYLMPNSLVIVGRREVVAPQLVALDMGKEPWLSFTDAVSPRERGVKAPTPPTPVGLNNNAAQLLDAAYAQKGGAAALAKLTQLTLLGAGTMSAQGHNVAVKVAEYYIPPTSVRADITIGSNTLVQVLSDKRSYIQQGEHASELPPALIKEMQKAYWRDPHFVLQNAKQTAKELRLPKADAALTVDGKPVDAIELVTPTDEVVTLLVDRASHDLLEVRYMEEGRPAWDRLSDYRVVDGIRLPFHAIRHTAGGETLEVTYSKITLDKPDAKLFQ